MKLNGCMSRKIKKQQIKSCTRHEFRVKRMKEENSQIEQQDLNVEKEVNEMKIEISEKSDKLIKKSISYLQIGLWTNVVLSVLVLISILVVFNKSVADRIYALILGTILSFVLIKMYAYIGDYKVFRETKTQQALEDLLDAQKGYYGWIYLLPYIMPILVLVYILVDFMSVGRY